MADRLEEILGKRFNSLKELKEEIKRLQDSIVNLNTDSEEFIETNKKLIAAQEQYTSVSRATKDVINANTGSLAEMERKYRDMYQQYKNMSKAAREGSEGLDLKDKLERLSNNINNIKKGVGDFKSNIGRYSESIIDAFSKMGGSVGGLVGPFKTATQGITAFNTALKANPVGAVITLIMTLIGVLKQLGSSIKDDEESQMRMNEAMASFQPIIDAAKNAMTAFGRAIVSVVEFLGKAVEKAREATAAFTDFLGITKGAKEAVKEQNKNYKDLAKSTDELTLKKREYQKLNAKDEDAVETLREEASETENLKEKRELLQKAKDKQAEIDQRNLELAKEDLRILQERSKLTSNSTEDEEELAEAETKVSQASATAARNARRFNRELKATEKATKSAAGALVDYSEEAKKIYEEAIENDKSEITRLTEKYEKEKKLLEKYHYDTTILTKQYNENLKKATQTANNEQLEKLGKQFSSMQTMWVNNAKAAGMSEAEINLQLAKNALDIYDWMAESVNNVMNDINAELKEGRGNLEGAWWAINKFIEEGKQLGLDIDFPPEAWPEDIKERMEMAKRVIGDYGVILKKKVEEMANDLRFDELDKALSQGLETNLYEYVYDLLQKDRSPEGYKKIVESVSTMEYEILNQRKIAYETELNDFQGTQEQKLEILQNYYAIVGEMREREAAAAELEAERNEAITTSAFARFDAEASAIQTITNAMSSYIQAQLNDGKITKQESEKKIKTLKKLEAVALAVNIAQIAASTAAGIMDVWKSYGAELALNAETAAATGPAAAATKAALDAKSLASAILRTGAIGTAGAANIAAAAMGSISKQQSLSGQLEGTGGSTGGVSAVANVQEIDSTPYTYTRTLQTQEEYDDLTQRPVWVSVSDIESGLNQRVRVVDESSF
jgi:hypothetical protein